MCVLLMSKIILNQGNIKLKGLELSSLKRLFILLISVIFSMPCLAYYLWSVVFIHLDRGRCRSYAWSRRRSALHVVKLLLKEGADVNALRLASWESSFE